LRGGGAAAAKMEILTRFIEVKVFLKESLKCTKIYIVGVVRGFLSTKRRFYVENQCKKTCFKCYLFNST